MVEGIVVEPKNSESAASVPATSQTEALFQRRIEFHPARKPYSALAAAGGDFHLETLNPSSDPQRLGAGGAGPSGPVVVASSGKRSDVGEFFEHGLDPELSFRTTFRRIGAGLQNLGNTCFLNSVLQCLTYTEPFAAYLQSGKHKTSCHTAGFCAMCALQNHVMIALQSTGKILSPFHLVKNLRCISRNFRNSRQEDAHEYMVNLLESMHKCCLPFGVPSESPSAYEKSLVHKIFGGHLRSQVKCMQCSFSSNKFDPFLDLSLEIVKADSLLKALRHFTAVEQLDGGERQYQCQHCKEKVRALKQLTIHKAPYVLTIHLKRFDSHDPGQKIDKKVEFQPNLELKPFVSDQHVEGLKYTLYGVLVHAGWSTHSGHYYCYVRTSSGIWHSLDDNQVSQVSEKTVLAQKAYMLFYVRDRSSTIKRPVDMVRKDSMPSNDSGNTVTSQSSSVSNRVVQNRMMERRLSNLEYCSAKLLTAGSYGQQNSKIETPPGGLLLDVASSLEINGKRIQNEIPTPQVNTRETSRGTPLLLANVDILSRGLQQATCSKVSCQQVEKDTTQPAYVKDNIVSTTTTRNENYNYIPTGFNKSNRATGWTTGSDQSNRIDGCNTKMNSDTFVAKTNKTSCPVPASQPHASSRKKEDTYENGDIATTSVHCDVSLVTSNKKIVYSDNNCKTQDNNLPAENEPTMLLSQAGDMNASMQKEALRAIPEECQNTADDENEKISSNLQHHVQKLTELGELRVVNSSKRILIKKATVQKEAILENGTVHFQTELKSKKLVKKCLQKGIYFGRNKIFFSSLSLHKIKKFRRVKRHRLNSMDVQIEDISLNDQGASTSETAKSVIVSSKRSCKKRSRSCLNEVKKNQKGKNGVCCYAEPVNTDRRVDGNLSKNSGKLGISEQSMNCLSRPRETDANDRNILQHDFMNLLTRGFKETTIPRWDDMDLPRSELNGLESSKRSIGYVLDEWDEEYDRGKKKKVRKSKQPFGGLNLFQEKANKQVQNSKVENYRLANQQFRV